MTERYLTPTLLEGVREKDIAALAHDYARFIKAVEVEWVKSNPFPIGAWSGNVWYDQIEARAQRWKQHINPLAIEWWRKNGYDVTIVPDGALTIGLLDAEITSPGITA